MVSRSTARLELAPSPGARVNLEQLRKQAKELVKLLKSLAEDASAASVNGWTQPAGVEPAQRHYQRLLKLIQQFHPRLRMQPIEEIAKHSFSLSDAQLVVARQQGFASWPQLQRYLLRSRDGEHRPSANTGDTVADAFLRQATTVPGRGHSSGSIEESESIRREQPDVVGSNIFTAAAFGDADSVRTLLDASRNPQELATGRGGPHRWDPLTYLCFSRYLRLARDGSAPVSERGHRFVEAASALLSAGAHAETGWFEASEEAVPFWEPALYGAAAVAGNAGVTQLLLDHGADPNDEETAYHSAEGYDHKILRILLGSRKLLPETLTTLLVRKADWHDREGMRLVLEAGADPNFRTRWGRTALQHSILRDNDLEVVSLLLEHWPQQQAKGTSGPAVENTGSSPYPGSGAARVFAARRGRADILKALEQHGIGEPLNGLDGLIAACAAADPEAAAALLLADSALMRQLRAEAGNLLSAFAANGNLEGTRLLLDLGLSPVAVSEQPDTYHDVLRGGMALHAAAWKMRHAVIRLLLDRGADVDATTAMGHTPLQLAVGACVHSYWTEHRSLTSIRMLVEAGAHVRGITLPTGYPEADRYLREHGA